MRNKKLFWLAVISISTLTTLALVSAKTKPVKYYSHEAQLKTAATSYSTSTVNRRDPANQNIETEIISIRPTGFEPTQISRPKGPFLLEVENRSGLKQIDFQLSSDLGTRILQIRRSWERLDWNQLIDPPVGQYILTEANHPDWRCAITITE